ncbi:hypothetical protein [Actinoplanes auranticolor]|uniref:Uncharacterized protein n=1 Tax=Actinoplanes auranticolor TaxID=47988 RepID=A0A919VTP9_9ACTN|nr:hypothetical protein [Actinoplanes auranticolor]GIM75492.1 hypothetical protein Aau02nite_66200 [Actinoplanes auranticolor]
MIGYDSLDIVAGQVQRGLGRGARAVRDPVLVETCLRQQYAWDRQVDSRDVYLARLVRDLGMPVRLIVARLHAAEPEFTVALGVLACLGAAGVEEAVDGVRDYIKHGQRGSEALAHVVSCRPGPWWEDLGPDRQPPAPRRTPLPAVSTGELLAVLRDPAPKQLHRSALRELARRPGEPELLDVLDTMDVTGLGGAVARATAPLGATAVPAARRWAEAGGPLRGAAVSTLAAHGDEADVPVLLAEVARLDDTPDQLCGYDELVTGLARLGGPVAAILRRLWPTPHSYERASYLRAYRIADPAVAESSLVEGLWDCEEDVRRVAAEHVVLDAETRERLSYLRDDPMEDAGVRGVAAARLES